MRKRLSRRRVKARARLGQRLPWSLIVDHDLQKWGEWERQFDTMMAHQIQRRTHGVDYFQRTTFIRYAPADMESV